MRGALSREPLAWACAAILSTCALLPTLMAMCAGREGKIISSFFPEAADIEGQDVFTHLWGYKNILKFNFQKRVEFNDRLCERIEREFPEETVIRELNVCR